MTLLYLLSDEETWNIFYDYKISLACPKPFAKELRSFIAEKKYLPVCKNIYAGESFPLPEKSIISKMGSDKKRVVYTYPDDENTVLKLLTFLLLRKYDALFSGNLYSFRPGRTAKDAMHRLLKVPGLGKMYAYKADIHDYFNSISTELFLPRLKETLDDEMLFAFLSGLLSEPNVIDRRKIITEQKGIMAGTPLSAFYANLFLSGLDKFFEEKNVLYARYSDDIIVFGPDEESVRGYSEHIKSFLAERKLTINPKKECFYSPEEGFTFLGFSYASGRVDIAPATIKKLKQKMRRKRDALARWHKRNGFDGEKAAKAFIRIFNRKLLESPEGNELSWSRHFFPVINTTDSLHELDLYAQDCLRYLIHGTHTKARYNVRYADLKKLGYRSLVNEYYAFSKRS